MTKKNVEQEKLQTMNLNSQAYGNTMKCVPEKILKPKLLAAFFTFPFQ